METNDFKLEKLIQEIETVRRRKVINYSDNTSSINYLDPYENLEKIKTPNNHLILGRRGSGKTTLLLSTIKQTHQSGFLLPIDCQIFREWKAEKIILHILTKILDNLKQHTTLSTSYNAELKNKKGIFNFIK
ncbi:ORC-CDC6 family AAA ATPase [Chryseobacterium artocarpi]|uniref:ORC-CDC6 family AAA ATPase n=1 Tax=Chryseobacterium artocarpi TaxID=1414727 RepID=UPI003F38FBFD